MVVDNRFDNGSTPVYFIYAQCVCEGVRERTVETDEGFVFIGKMTELFNELHIPRGYYSSIRALLFDTVPTVDAEGYELPISEPCLTYLKRGASTKPSEVLYNRPLSELDLDWYRNSVQPLTSVGGRATVVGEAGERLAGLENEVTKIKMVLQNFESRIRELEA